MAGPLPTGTMFGRVAAVTIASPDGSGVDPASPRFVGLRTRFHIERSIKPEPNKADVTITNLSANTRAQIKDTSGRAVSQPMYVTIEAGYQPQSGPPGPGLQVLMKGTAHTIAHTRDGPDWNTRIQCNDGGAQYAGARSSFAWRGAQPVAAIVRRLCADLGVQEGNLNDAVAQLNSIPGAVTKFSNGFAAHGLSSKALSQVLTAARCEWSIQDGALQILQPGATINNQAYLLNQNTGLIGSPKFGENDPKRGIYMKAKCLLLPALRPGSLVQLDAVATKGLFRCEKVIHSGDTHGEDWCTELELCLVGSG